MQSLAGRLNFQVQARVLPSHDAKLHFGMSSAFFVPKGLAAPLGQCTGTEWLGWPPSRVRVRSDWRCSWDKALAQPWRAALACPVCCNPHAVLGCTSPPCLQQQPALSPELLLLEWTVESPGFAQLLKVVSEDTARNVFQCTPAKADSEVFG